MRALLVTFDAGGNLPPALGIAQRVVADGGEALVLGAAAQSESAAAAGVAFMPHSAPAPFRPLDRTNPLRGVVRLTRTTCGQEIADDLLREAASLEPDVVVVDCMLLRPLAAAVEAGYRTVTLVHSFPSFFAGSYGRGPIGWLARTQGQDPARVWGAAAASIATVLPSLEQSGRAPGPWADLRLVGPVAPVVDGPAFIQTAASRKRPRLLISLSTVWYPGQDRTLQKLLDAVSGLDVDAVMTTGRSVDPADLRIPPNAQVHRYVDHDALLRATDLVVSHGGHGTAMRALAHDTPLLIIPGFSMTDQPTVGARIEAAGAGQVLPASSSVERLRAAIGTLAGPGPHRDASRRLGQELRALDPAGAAVDVLRARERV